jgi:hypothetical protein
MPILNPSPARVATGTVGRLEELRAETSLRFAGGDHTKVHRGAAVCAGAEPQTDRVGR